MGQGYGSVIGLIVAAGVFAVGMKEIGLIPAFIDMLKQSNEIARWGASFGPFLLAVLTGSGRSRYLGLQSGGYSVGCQLRNESGSPGTALCSGRTVRPHGFASGRLHHHRRRYCQS